MEYLNCYYTLKKVYNYSSEKIAVLDSDICIHNLNFKSDFNNNFPDDSESKFIADKNKEEVRSISSLRNCVSPESLKIFGKIDSELTRNNSFIYPVYKNSDNKKSDSVIILLHGLNEKNWDKYHTWAKYLLEHTGKAVLMFPISFHINRVPPEWTHPRLMDNLSKERKAMFPGIMESSFVNAAISTRLQFKPETFFWSGLRTFYDLKKLITLIKDDNHPLISKESSIDFFSYSIGAFLTEIMLMENFNGWLSDSKAFLFCGGPTMSGMHATSKYIYDSETYNSMTNFYVNNFDEEMKKSKGMRNYFDKPGDAAADFRSMLNINILKQHRENKFKNLSGRIKALALVKDEVIPPVSVVETLKGENNNIPVDVKVLDFPFEYDHISPFPLGEKIRKDVNESFNEVFTIAGDFLK